jgi:hypothetical protein
MGARYFLHLYKGDEVLRDEAGVEIHDPDQMRDVCDQIIREMLRERELNLSELDGWEARVVDAAGAVVQTFRLSDLKDGC